MSTITDVARVAGVSVATVSRALRGLDRVSPETRRRVLAVAEQLHYVASPTATSLASGRTNVVGVIVPYLTRWYFARLVSGIEKGLRDHGHHVLLVDLESETYEERRPLTQNMLWKRVDGVITLNLPLSPDEVELIARLGLPLVAVGPPVAGRSSVRIDDTEAQRMAVRHLIELGHERIGYVGAVTTRVDHLKTPQDRLRSFEATMADAGLPVDPRHVLRSDWTAGAAARDSRAMLERPDRPTAVAAGSDEMAIGVRETARHLGLRVPEDLSIVGIDDYLLSEVLDLTTVRQDVAGQGKLAAELLLTSLNDREAETTDVVWPVELVVRGSTAPPPG